MTSRTIRVPRLALLALALALLPLSGANCGAGPKLKAVLAGSGLVDPTFLTAPQADPRLFVVERAGRIQILENGSPLEPPFLDIHAQVSTGGERGMFGLAFPDDYATSGLFYLYYTDLAGASTVSRFTVSGDPDVADPESEDVLLSIAQPSNNHNGGTIAFSPDDGMLYFSPGDGGGPNDPQERAQNPLQLLGKMLRIDVSGGPGSGYMVPPDNPFVGVPGVLPEIWAFGLRNPFRFAFDAVTGDLWIADVGQGAREEIDFEAASDPGGRNYGWDVMEGSICNPDDPAPSPPCNDPSLTPPIHEYLHTGERCAITGGTVYRGSMAAFVGRYFFGDYCTGEVWARSPDGSVRGHTVQLFPSGAPTFELVAISEDGFGELYLVLLGGDVYQIVPAP